MKGDHIQIIAIEDGKWSYQTITVKYRRPNIVPIMSEKSWEIGDTVIHRYFLVLVQSVPPIGKRGMIVWDRVGSCGIVWVFKNLPPGVSIQG